MSDLITWLRRQLDDDARVALAATSGPWQAEVSENGLAGDVEHVTSSHDEYYCCTAEDATHIARWDPARVLAEVEAKRRIIDEAIRLMSYDSEFQFLELLAQPYAGRDGWREEWRVV